VDEVKRHLDPAVLDTFAWRFFELCLARREAADVKWGLVAVGLLGGDASALKLTPLVRDWPGEGFSQRAGWGLEALRAIGSDTAMMQLSGIAQKVKFKSLQGKARTFMREIAAARNLSEQQLEDRIVPDLGLDERGGRTLDYGPRQFRVVFGPNLKPRVKDDQGKVKSGLPKPTAKDDAAMAAEADREWKLLKKQAAEVQKFQAKRLEKAMVSRRRWPAADFERYLVHHPFMGNFARLLLWGCFDRQGGLSHAFRVTEDRTYADIDDTEYRLPAESDVGIVHPLQLTDEQRAKWGEVFGDYEIIPPFPQLGRRFHLPQPGEEDLRELTRFGGVGINEIMFHGIMKQQGWVSGRWGKAYGQWKRFPEADVTAVIEMGYVGGGVEIRSVYFVPGTPGDNDDVNRQRALRMKEVEPVTLSEVLGILAVLVSKGEK